MTVSFDNIIMDKLFPQYEPLKAQMAEISAAHVDWLVIWKKEQECKNNITLKRTELAKLEEALKSIEFSRHQHEKTIEAKLKEWSRRINDLSCWLKEAM